MHQVLAVLQALARDGRWRKPLALAVAFAIGCALLSWWQFARRAETAHANALVVANYNAEPRPLGDVLRGLGGYSSDQQWMQVQVTGTYLVRDQLLVRDRQLGGNPGFEVLTPLRLPDGDVFVVDRGFLNVGTKQDRPDTVPPPPSGRVTVVARLQANEHAIPGRSAPAGEIPSIDLGAVAKDVGAPTFTGAYGLMVSETPPAARNPIPLEPPSFGDDEGTHLSYAIQWIMFALIAFFGLAWSVRRSLRDAGDPDILEADERAAARRSTRAPSDEAVEDSLLDADR
ncbi:SURF1 family protein [Amnibacterium sp.]|uniref:SURF1 family cytochrome oxidase biogenesis protein n=1 Tax=Amnibacterium sp. TaxID=1872496 RepID=UPI00260D325F|nr:SURF1 family protein [Amnibacterium sp.]MCU1472304.1 conserved rane protein [Amnibacterium sp.]